MTLVSIENFAIIHEDNTNIYANNQVLSDVISVDEIFSNQQRDKTHKVVLIDLSGDVSFEGRRVQHKMLHFFKAVEKFEGSQVLVTRIVRKSTQQIQEELQKAIGSREFQMILNVVSIQYLGVSYLMTYDERGYCLIVPTKREHLLDVGVFLKVS